MRNVRAVAALLVLLLSIGGAMAQSPGTAALHGPSSNPALPLVTPEAIAAALNAALTAKADASSGVLTNPSVQGTLSDSGDLSVGGAAAFNGQAPTGAGIVGLFASPPATGSVIPAPGTFTTVSTTLPAASRSNFGINFVAITDYGGISDCRTVSGAMSVAQNANVYTLTNGSFSSGDVGKKLFFQVGGPFSRYNQIVGTITAVNSATTVTLSTSWLTFSMSNWGGANASVTVWYGTDNTTPIINAGAAAVATNARYLWFPSGTTCAFSLDTAADASAVGNLIWVGQSGANAVLTDSSGNKLRKIVVQNNAGAPVPPEKGVFGKATMPRFAATSTPCVAVWGDSMGGDPPSANTTITGSPIYNVSRALTKANPAKTIQYQNYAIGGATFFWLDAVPPGPFFPPWYTNTSASWESYVKTGCAGSATPDLVLLMENGVNDGPQMSEETLQSVIGKIRAWPTSGGLPPDIIMVSGRGSSLVGNFSGGGNLGFQFGHELSSQVLRTAARAQGFGFLDYEDMANQAQLGWSTTRERLAVVPSLDETDALWNAGWNVGYLVRDYEIVGFFQLNPSGATTWSRWGTASFQIGSRTDNVAIMGADASGNLTVQINSWGTFAPSTLSITASSATLTSTGQNAVSATYSSSTISIGGAAAQTLLTLSSGTISGCVVGMAMAIPGADYGGAVFRSFVTQCNGASQVTLVDVFPQTVSNQSSTLTYGGMIFAPRDATAAVDVIVPGAGSGGTDLLTKVTGYTSATQVTLGATAGTTLSGSSASMFLGRATVPRFSTTLNVTGSPGANPGFDVAVLNDTVSMRYITIPSQTFTRTVSINAASNALTSTTSLFTSDMAGAAITIPAAGAGGAALATAIKTVNSATSAALVANASTTLTGQSEALIIGTSPIQVYRGPAERWGGPFNPTITPSNRSPGTNANVLGTETFVGQFEPVMPILTDAEMWGVTATEAPFGGNGINHPGTPQYQWIDPPVVRSQDWTAQ